MPADIEEALRRCLRARAADVVPDPATWQRVQQRIRHRRTLRWAAAGVAVAAVAALAAVIAGLVLTADARYGDVRDCRSEPPLTCSVGP